MGTQIITGKNAPMAMEIPPLLGIGSTWTFLASGSSTKCMRKAIRLNIGTKPMVRNNERINVVNRYISFRLSAAFLYSLAKAKPLSPLYFEKQHSVNIIHSKGALDLRSSNLSFI
jgi:hypothetical protein